jgi:hypothetical protein
MILTDKAADVLLSKAELKEKIFSNLVTEIDGCQQDEAFGNSITFYK